MSQCKKYGSYDLVRKLPNKDFTWFSIKEDSWLGSTIRKDYLDNKIMKVGAGNSTHWHKVAQTDSTNRRNLEILVGKCLGIHYDISSLLPPLQPTTSSTSDLQLNFIEI